MCADDIHDERLFSTFHRVLTWCELIAAEIHKIRMLTVTSLSEAVLFLSGVYFANTVSWKTEWGIGFAFTALAGAFGIIRYGKPPQYINVH